MATRRTMSKMKEKDRTKEEARTMIIEELRTMIGMKQEDR